MGRFLKVSLGLVLAVAIVAPASADNVWITVQGVWEGSVWIEREYQGYGGHHLGPQYGGSHGGGLHQDFWIETELMIELCLDDVVRDQNGNIDYTTLWGEISDVQGTPISIVANEFFGDVNPINALPWDETDNGAHAEVIEEDDELWAYSEGYFEGHYGDDGHHATSSGGGSSHDLWYGFEYGGEVHTEDDYASLWAGEYGRAEWEAYGWVLSLNVEAIFHGDIVEVEIHDDTPPPNVPEPATLGLMGIGLLGIAARKKFFA